MWVGVMETPVSLPPSTRLKLILTLPLSMAGNETTVNQSTNSQYRTIVPRALADANDLNGKKLAWFTEPGNAFHVEIVDE